MNAAASSSGIGMPVSAFPMPGAVGGSAPTPPPAPPSTTHSASSSNYTTAPANPNPWGGASSNSTPTNPINRNPWSPTTTSSSTPPPPLHPLWGGVDPSSNMMNLDNMASMLQNPMMQSMMQQMTANPAMMRSLMEASPQFQSMDPQLRETLLHPDVLRAAMNPNAIMQMQQAMQQLQGVSPPSVPTTVPSSANPINPFAAFQSGLFPGSVPASPVNPEELYASQLTQLTDMGFTNREQNVRALQATFGNVNAAVDRILSGLS
jgi:ubiquilin